MNQNSSNSPLSIDIIKIEKAAKVSRAINHKLRQKMLKLIDEQGRMTVTSIYIVLRLEQSVASQHLAILRKEEFVSTEREGKFIFYSVNYQRLKEVHRVADELTDYYSKRQKSTETGI